MTESTEDTGTTPTSFDSTGDTPATPVTPAVPASDAPTDPVAAALKDLGLDDAAVTKLQNELGVTSVDDLRLLKEADLTGAGVKPIQARKLLASFQPATADTAVASSVAFDAVLPAVPADGAWLEALRTGGVLRVEQSTVISAVRAALARRVGLFDVPERLSKAMEDFSYANEEPVDPEFFKLREQVTRRTYGDIFAALDGMDGRFVSEKRKQELFNRIDQHLWPAVIGFYDQLSSWQQAWVQQGANPALLMVAIAGNMGGAGAALPPGMMQPPDTAVLRDQADAVNDAINRVFAGPGVQIAAALAYEATQIRQSLENPRLPQMIGAANREQMLKQLGIAVSSTYPRLEINLTRFVLATMQAKNQPGGNEELQYFGTMAMLGTQIPWDELGGRSTANYTGIGDRRRPGYEL